MNYQELNAMHNDYEKRKDEWLDSLLVGAFDLRKAISTEIEEPAPWEDKGIQHPYVALNKLADSGAKSTKLMPKDLYANRDGVFPFSVSITFEPGPNSFPKSEIWLAVGVKAINNQICYTLWDRENDCPANNGTWIESAAAAAAMVIERFEKYFAFDPAGDFANRPTMGFI